MAARFGLPLRGRGTSENPPNRFEPIVLEPDFEHLSSKDVLEAPDPATQYLRDTTRTIICHNTSPDVGFEYSINPYRGCEHGCVYCYARPTHEYFGLSAGLDFETRIFVKIDAPQLLRRELMNPKWKPVSISISGVTDCYQPIERKLCLTRGCLEVLAELRHPCSVITKNHLVTRDADVLRELARARCALVILSVTTLDTSLAARMEPRTSSPSRRLAAIEALAKSGIPVGVMIAPVIPGLSDHEIPAILNACADHGASFAGYVPLRLPGAVAPLFKDWLARHYPDRKEKVLNRIRDLRGGKLNDSNFHSRMRGQGAFADQFKQMFELAKRKAGLDKPGPELCTTAFSRPEAQPGLF
jgi:DNA repair photolyase